jgi:hypothetical protein
MLRTDDTLFLSTRANTEFEITFVGSMVLMHWATFIIKVYTIAFCG